MKYINLRDIKAVKNLEHISNSHAQKYMSQGFHHRKGSQTGEKIRYSIMKLIFKNGKEFFVKVAEISPCNGYYEHPFLIRKKDFDEQ